MMRSAQRRVKQLQSSRRRQQLLTSYKEKVMSSQWHGGKGSARRPEDSKKVEDNWNRIFGKNEEGVCEECSTHPCKCEGEVSEQRKRI